MVFNTVLREITGRQCTCVVSTLNKYYIKVVNILINYNNCALMANRYYHPID